MSKVHYTGHQGSWLVDVTGFGKLPTALKPYLKGLRYERTDGTMALQPGKLSAWVEAIKTTGMVVLTGNEIKANHASKTEAKRTISRVDYIGVYEIADLVLEGNGEVHSFNLVKRLTK